MFCHNCGSKLEEGDLFCPECGTRVEQQPEQNYSEDNWNTVQENPQPGNYWEEQGMSSQPDPNLYQEPEEFRRQEKRRAKQEAQKKKNQTLTLVLLGAAIVVLTGAVIFGVWMLTRPESEEDYTAPQVAASPTEEPEAGDKEEDEVQVMASPIPTATPTEEPVPTKAPVTVVTVAPTATPTATPAPEAAGDYIFPDSNSRYLSYEEVAAKSAQELSYARNEIFARHGRKFKSEELQAYFNSKSWYTPVYEPDEFTTALQDRLFNNYEKENIKQITKVENDKGYTS